MNTHDRTTNLLEKRLEDSCLYEAIMKNEEYFIENRIYGEVDLLGFRLGRNDQKYLFLFEVKSYDDSHLRAKAEAQLRKHELILGDNADRIFKFYVVPDYKRKDGVKIEWIK